MTTILRIPQWASLIFALLAFSTTVYSQKLEMVVQTSIGPISALALSSDGQFLLTGLKFEGEAVLWEVSTGREIRRFRGHMRGLQAVAFSPDGRGVLTGSEDGSARLWETATGREIVQFGTPSPSKQSEDHIVSVGFSDNGQVVVTGNKLGTIRWWDIKTRSELNRRRAVVVPVRVIKESPDGRFIVAGGSYPKFLQILWRSDVGTKPQNFSSGSKVQSISISDDGLFILTGHQDGVARLWEAKTGDLVREFKGHEVMLPKTRELLNPPEDDSLAKMRAHQKDDGVLSVSLSADGRLALTGGADGTARLWEVATGRQIRQFDGHSSWVSSVVFAENGQSAFTGGFDGTVRLWDIETGKEVRRFEGYTDAASSLLFSTDNQFLLTGGSAAALWKIASGEVQRLDPGVDFYSGEIMDNAVSFHRSRALFALMKRDGAVRMWDVRTGEQTRSISEIDGAPKITSFAISPDHRFIAIGTQRGGTRLLETDTGKEIHSFISLMPGSNITDVVIGVMFSPDSRYLLTVHLDYPAGRVVLWDIETRREIRHFEHQRGVFAASLSTDGRLLVTAGNNVRVWEVETGRMVRELFATPVWSSVAISPDDRYVLTGSMSNNTVHLSEIETGRIVHKFEGHRFVGRLAFSPDGRLVATTDVAFGPVRLWEVETGRELARLMSFKDGNWVVIDPDGRFDASNGGEIDGLHWVVGLETIAIRQLKERYYEPGLLAKIMGFNDEPLRDVKAFTDPKLYPGIDLKTPQLNDAKLKIHLTNRGGGIGKVIVSINGKEISSDARTAKSDPNAKAMQLAVNIADHPYLVPGQENTIEVKAFNAEGYLSSRNVRVLYQAPNKPKIEPPMLWAIVAGVSDYRGDQIDLRYAAKDAVDFAHALQIGAKRLFGVERLHLKLLTTEASSEAMLPSKANLLQAFQEMAKAANSKDILVVYLAGHGVNYGGPEGDFYYLLNEARSGDLNDPEVRSVAALSSAELTELIKQVPALKQVLILDTCASGRLVEKLIDKRDISSSTIRAFERMKDRVGMFVLAGAAADAVSYEASRYGQGLLTYSLLLGMRGAALRDDEFVDISKLFQFSADQVPELAKDIGGIQRPIVAAPRLGTSFDIGRLTSTDKPQIPLSTARPLVLRANFQDDERILDHLDLTKRVNDALKELSARGRGAPLIFVDAFEFPQAYLLAGRYRAEGNTITVIVHLFRDKETVGRFTVEGQTSDLDRLLTDILRETEMEISALSQ